MSAWRAQHHTWAPSSCGNGNPLVSESSDVALSTATSVGLSRLAPIGRLMERPQRATSPKTRTRHVLTINVEDYFQVGAFSDLISDNDWYRFESRIVENTNRTLELLRKHNATATFFVLGWIAERWPELIRTIVEAGHEVASRGFYHRNLDEVDPRQFQDELARTRQLLESSSGQRVVGFRVADGWLKSKHQWLLDLLKAEDYEYDSSVCPLGWQHAFHPEKDLANPLNDSSDDFWEFPISTWRCMGANVPIGGGNYLRQLPQPLLRHAINQWPNRTDRPLVMYFHVWELDPQQPQISSASRLTRLRHYRNLDRMSEFLEELLSQHQFSSISDYLGLDLQTGIAPTDIPDAHPGFAPHLTPRKSLKLDRESVTIVIPCYNEETAIPYLSNTLESVEYTLSEHYKPEFLFVDDCSTDSTFELLEALLGTKTNARVIRQSENKGVMGAILTGIREAKSELVCSMDCDCSYDPHELQNMLPKLTDGVDLVTASPYHRDGHVKNVPAWRLLLSKGLSQLYRFVLPVQLQTYTSCFRVYRRSAAENVTLSDTGFLGVAEFLGKLAMTGSKIVEHPATLEVRIFGESKMKTMRTIRGHLGLLAKFIKSQLFTRQKKDIS